MKSACVSLLTVGALATPSVYTSFSGTGGGHSDHVMKSMTNERLLKGERDLSTYSFKDYVQEFEGKTYKSWMNDKREQIFNENLKIIRNHNAQANKTFFMTVNKFTDMTKDEFKAGYHGALPHTKAILAGSRPVPTYTDPVPDSKDWRDVDGVVTPVKNQGGCGSCWAFAATETLESHLAIATGKSAPLLSPQQIVSCAPNPDECGGTGGCSGATAVVAMNYTAGVGITTDADYPYTGRTGTCEPSKITPAGTNTGYVVPTPNNYTELVAALANEGPVAISISASTSAFQFYGGGVMGDYDGCGWVQDHAVQLVGYGTDGDQMYWSVRNSWGASWGEEGYIRMQRFGEGSEPCGTDSSPEDGEACKGDHAPRKYCGTCGVLGSSAYPTGMKPAYSQWAN